VVLQFPENPGGNGYLIGADEQLRLAVQHTGFMRDQLGAGNLAEAQRHAEHVVNILDGEAGPTFGDLDGDGLAQNPGDGVGVRGYAEGAKKHTQFAADTGDASFEVRLHAGHTIVSLDNMLNWLDEAIRQAVRVISSDTAEEAAPAGEELSRVVDLMVNGQDLNGDGVVAPVEGEGGLLVAYEHALNMGSFEFFLAEDLAGGSASEGGAGANPEPVTIEMADLAYQPGDITVPAGATVTWVNKDTVLHSATADDGSFDTGLLDPGASASVTFDKPGTYVYYCEMHGVPGGQGMTATIVVRDNIY
jgi:plastocyanin